MGGVSAAVSKTAAAPIERVKLLMQNQVSPDKPPKLKSELSPSPGPHSIALIYMDRGFAITLLHNGTDDVQKAFKKKKKTDENDRLINLENRRMR